MALKGVAAMQAKLRKAATNLPLEVGRALRIETEIEATECKKRCPVASGNLRASIHVTGPEFEPGPGWPKIFTEIVCGGPAAPYAVYVHEDLEAFHKVGEAKFIEGPLLESRKFMAERVAKRINLKRVIT